MNMKLIPRQIQVVFEDESRKVVASMNIFINGESGTLYALLGRNILYALVDYLPDISDALGVNQFYAVVEPLMYRLLKRLFKNRYKTIEVAKIREITLTDKLMFEVLLKPIKEQTNLLEIQGTHICFDFNIDKSASTD